MAKDEKKPRRIKIGGMSIETKGDLTKKPDKKLDTKKPEPEQPVDEAKPTPDISSTDVAAREFTQRVKGYDPQEVKEFLEAVAVKMAALEEEVKTGGGGGVSEEVVAELNAKIQALEKENQELKEKLASSGAKGDEAEKAAKIIAGAQAFAEKIKAEAEEEAKHRIQEAELEASGKRAEIEKQLDELKNEVQRLSHLKEDFISRVEQTLREFNDIINRYKK